MSKTSKRVVDPCGTSFVEDLTDDGEVSNVNASNKAVTINGSGSISFDQGISVSFSTKLRRTNTEPGQHSSQESLTNLSVDSPPAAAGSKEASHCRQNSKDMSNLTDMPTNGSVTTPVNGENPATNQRTDVSETTTSASFDVTVPQIDQSKSRESTPEGQISVSRSNNHSSTMSQPSDLETNGSRGSQASTNISTSKPVSLDLENMKVSLILHDDDYDLDDLCITSSRTVNATSSSDGGYPSPRSTPPNSLSNIAESSNDAPLEWSRDKDYGFSGVGFREGRRTPTNGQHSDSSSRVSLESMSPTGSGVNKLPASSKSSTDRKKKPYWYNVLSPTYKSKSEDFKRIFKDIPGDERLIVDYSCALQKDILVHGRIYITQNWICFYANIFRWETVVMLKCKDITTMTKEKTARVIPNAIQICTKDDKYFFTSFGTRDKTYLMLFRVWQNALTDNPMNMQELWQWVRYSYGEELGLNSSDEDYIQPSTEEEIQFHQRVMQEEKLEVEAVGLSDIKNPDDEALTDSLLNGNDPNLAQSDGDDHADNVPGLQVSPHHKTPTLEILSADVPTDQGDTTEDEDLEEVLCTDHDHLDIAVIEEGFNFSVDKLFEMIFTESQLYRHFTEVKKTTELVQSQWSEDVDEAGDRHRTISYTLSLNYSIGPKTSPATEKQVLRACSKPGSFYLIDTECINSSIPYGDNFYVVNRYCMARVSTHKCRLKITSAIRYRKSVWGLVKNFIEKNVTAGISDSFTCIADLLKQESIRLGQQNSLAPPAGKKKVLRRRRNVSDRAQAIKRSPSESKTTGHAQSTPVKNPHSKSVKECVVYTSPTIYPPALAPSENLAWLELTGDICKKASRRIRFLEVLKRSGCTEDELVTYYVSIVQSVLDYAAPLWHGNLTEEESDKVEKIQQRALMIIYPELEYNEALQEASLETVKERRRGLFEWYFRRFWDCTDGYKLNLTGQLQDEAIEIDEDDCYDPHGHPFAAVTEPETEIEEAPQEYHNHDNQINHVHSETVFQDTDGVSSKSKEEWQQRVTADILVRVVCAVLIVLAVFNALLYYKLWSLEQKATLISYNRQNLWRNAEEQPQSPEEWMHLMEQQQMLHDTEIERWKDILSASVKLMDNMQKTLGSLEQGINARYSKMAAAGTAHDEH